ncbi:MAG: quinohemoprotein amine dehydrogenase subunit alpha [Gammaproteobacteria bacterium]
MGKRWLHVLSFITASALAAINLPLAQAADEGESVLNARCAACHQRQAEGGLSRISEMRKSPEGWDMSIVRMMLIHGVSVTPDERRVLVKHLADTQGLAPEEAQEWRYILERQPSATDASPDDDLAAMCGRCHSFARVGLQRRDEAEWLKLAHFHLGQYPTAEYQALGRDRNWWEIASTEVPKKLGELYPLNTGAWAKWKGQAKTDPIGTWRVVGHRPGAGSYQGTLSVTGSGNDEYRIELDITYGNGSKAAGAGSATVFTGYEWRGRLKLGEEKTLQVLTVSGTEMTGRWFLEDSDSLGASIHGTKAEGASARVLSVEPAYLRAGETAKIALHGIGLRGKVELGDGVKIKVIEQSPMTILVEAKASESAAAGVRSISVGGAQATDLFTVYRKIDSVRVQPAYTIARVGDAGGPLPSVPAQFDAVGFLNGPDGKSGTDDDIRIGVFPARWSVENFNKTAARMNDAKYAGTMEAGGLFLPAGAGLNPQRPYSTNNVGNLAVKAAVSDGDSTVEGNGRLVVTVQRWNDPPIR